MSAADMDEIGIPKQEQPKMWGVVQTAHSLAPPSRAASSMAHAAPDGPRSPPRSSSVQLRGPPKQLSGFDLSKSGRIASNEPSDQSIRKKQDNMVQMPIGQSFMQPTMKAHANNPAPRLVERPKTYRHATLSARRNNRHQWNSLAMPSTEITRWAAESGFGEAPSCGVPHPQTPFLDPRPLGAPMLQTEAAHDDPYSAPAPRFSPQRSRRRDSPGKANAWWSYAASNSPKCILPHVLPRRGFSS